MIRPLYLLVAFSLCLIGLKTPSLSIGSETKNENLTVCPQENVEDARKRYLEEQSNIKQSDGKVVRKGKRLELRTRDRTVQFDDNCHNGEAYVRYKFETYIKDKGYYLLSYTGYEWGGFFFINDRSGDKTSLFGKPVFSPDRNKLITISMDLEAHEMINAMRIYRLDSEGPTLVFDEDFDEEWGPSDPIWLNNSSIKFVKNTCDSPCTKYHSSAAYLVLKGKTWVIQDVPQ
jgi:hypothetical protein